MKKAFLISSIAIFFTLFLMGQVFAQSYQFNKDSGINDTADSAGYATGADAETVDSLVGTMIYVFLGLVGVIFFAFTIYNGVRWMTAQGNEEKVIAAKNGLLNSIVGLIITAGAYALSYFIMSFFT